MYNIGNIVKVKESTRIAYGLDPLFTKNESRPFVVCQITDQNYYWIVPSYSNGDDYENNSKSRKYFTCAFTSEGTKKYLNYRNMIPAKESDIKPYKITISTLNVDQMVLDEINKKFFRVKIYLRDNYEELKDRYQHCFEIEKKIMMDYLKSSYRWLERDFNIVDPDRKFSSKIEFEKTDIANTLYHNYLENLKHFLTSRNTYLPVRKDECVLYFNTYKIEILYKCCTDDGYISSLNPLCYTDSFNDATKIREDDLQQIKEDYVYEPISSKVPLLNENEEKKIASELIWLDNNIVSQKTYYDVYGKLPGKQEIRAKIEDAKRKSV